MALQKMIFLVFAFVFCANPAMAENARVPASAAQVKLSFAPVAKAAAPAVVNIYARKVVRQRAFSPFMGDPFFQHFFGDAVPDAPMRQRLESSLGSGVIVQSDGLIVTSNHVIDGADQITVILQDRREFAARVVASDKKADLAALRIDPKGASLTALDLRDSDMIEVGDLVLAIGNPFGVGQSVTSGIVSALARTSTDINDMNYFIQTDAAINPGNSGGALVTMDGKLVGINAAIFSRDGGNMGIGFAVPSNMVRAFMEAVAAGHKSLPRSWTGLKAQEVTADVAASLNLPRPAGVLVREVEGGSPAAKAGLKVGDVIWTVDDKPVNDVSAFRYRMVTARIGQPLALGVMRQGKIVPLSLTPADMPKRSASGDKALEGRNPLSGVTVAEADAVALDEEGDAPARGVVLIDVPPASNAAQLGLQRGDILRAINGRPVETVADVQKALQQRAARWHLKLQRGVGTIDLVVGG